MPFQYLITLLIQYLKYSASSQFLASSCNLVSPATMIKQRLMSPIVVLRRQNSAPSLITLSISVICIFFSLSLSKDFQQMKRQSPDRQINLSRCSFLFQECFIIMQPFFRLANTSWMVSDYELASLSLFSGDLNQFRFISLRISPKARPKISLILVTLPMAIGEMGLERVQMLWVQIPFIRQQNYIMFSRVGLFILQSTSFKAVLFYFLMMGNLSKAVIAKQYLFVIE